MSRLNTDKCWMAFYQGVRLNAPRDRIVTIGSGVVTWELHGNVIARKETNYGTGEKTLFLSTCGWDTNTTWDRLRCISRHYGIEIDRKSFSSGSFSVGRVPV